MTDECTWPNEFTFMYRNRSKYPETEFQTQAVRCPGGKMRLVTLPKWYWGKLEWLIQEEYITRRKIIALNWNFCKKYQYEHPEHDFDHNFQDGLGYLIRLGYEAYLDGRDNWFVANYMFPLLLSLGDQNRP